MSWTCGPGSRSGSQRRLNARRAHFEALHPLRQSLQSLIRPIGGRAAISSLTTSNIVWDGPSARPCSRDTVNVAGLHVALEYARSRNPGAHFLRRLIEGVCQSERGPNRRSEPNARELPVSLGKLAARDLMRLHARDHGIRHQPDPLQPRFTATPRRRACPQRRSQRGNDRPYYLIAHSRKR